MEGAPQWANGKSVLRWPDGANQNCRPASTSSCRKPCVPATLGPPNSKRPGCLDLSQTKAKLCFWRRREIAFWRWRRSLPTRLWMIRPLADFVSFMFGKPPADEASPIEWSGTAWRSPGGAGRTLRLHTDNAFAARLYERHGFQPAGSNPRATHTMALAST